MAKHPLLNQHWKFWVAGFSAAAPPDAKVVGILCVLCGQVLSEEILQESLTMVPETYVWPTRRHPSLCSLCVASLQTCFSLSLGCLNWGTDLEVSMYSEMCSSELWWRPAGGRVAVLRPLVAVRRLSEFKGVLPWAGRFVYTALMTCFCARDLSS